jgi:hypothetical protein
MQTDVGFVQMPAETVDDAVRLAEWVDGQKKNAYFALASFQEEHLNEKGKRRVARKRKNVDQLKALWVDIDYKSCPNPTKAGAVDAVKDFLRESGFLKPTAMVSSGNGIHLYWPLDHAVDFATWSPLAVAFKQLCQQFGLPADHAVTADSARVLRPIGTHNWKDVSNPKPVVWVGGSGDSYSLDILSDRLGVIGVKGNMVKHGNESGLPGHARSDLPEHLARAAAENDASEFTKGNARPQITKQVFQKCGVMQHVLKTGGAEQSEPEWNATLMLLAHLDDGAKFVHRMSEKHPDYDPDITMEKWQQKVEAVEDGSGPTLCATFEGYYEDICKACPFHKSKRVKTPKSLAYLEPETPAPSDDKSSTPKLVPVAALQQGAYPKNWRVGGNGDCIERKIWNGETKEYEWMPVLSQVWTLTKACRNIRDDFFVFTVVNKLGSSVRRFDVPSWQLGTNTDLSKTLASYGCPIVAPPELKNWKELMSTWIEKLRKENAIEDITDQLGWIENDEDESIIGFASGEDAYFLDGTQKTGIVSPHSKHKGIVDSFRSIGSIEPWRDAVKLIIDQGCDHLIAMIATAFAGPLVKFTEQQGAVVSLMSEDSAAGKSTGMRVAQAVWGNPRHAPATMSDTPTVVKNKLAFLQNITAYWDEVRGTDEKMLMFLDIAYQVTQGRDRERANSSAETIRAQEWELLLATASNDSLFDIAAGKIGDSDSGVYRIFEIQVPKAEYPAHDAGIMSCVNQLDTNYGHAGKVYAKWLTENFDRCQTEVMRMVRRLESKVTVNGPERFWIVAIATMVMGAKYANEAGLTTFDVPRLSTYLINTMYKLRARAVEGRTQLSARELIAAYAQQHQDGKVTLDWFPTGRGGKRQPILQGNHASVRKVSYVEATETGKMMVSKSDFTTWLRKSKNLRFNDKLQAEFQEQAGMIELKSQLAAGTKYAIPRAMCLVFDLSNKEDDEDAEQD